MRRRRGGEEEPFDRGVCKSGKRQLRLDGDSFYGTPAKGFMSAPVYKSVSPCVTLLFAFLVGRSSAT